MSGELCGYFLDCHSHEGRVPVTSVYKLDVLCTCHQNDLRLFLPGRPSRYKERQRQPVPTYVHISTRTVRDVSGQTWSPQTLRGQGHSTVVLYPHPSATIYLCPGVVPPPVLFRSQSMVLSECSPRFRVVRLGTHRLNFGRLLCPRPWVDRVPLRPTVNKRFSSRNFE